MLCSATSRFITKLTSTPEYVFINSSAAIQIKYFTRTPAFWIRLDWRRQRNFVYCRWRLCMLIKLTQKRNVMYGVAPFQLQLADSIIRSDINSIKWHPELFKLPLKCSNMQSRYWDMLMLMRDTFVNKKNLKRLLLFPGRMGRLGALYGAALSRLIKRVFRRSRKYIYYIEYFYCKYTAVLNGFFLAS